MRLARQGGFQVLTDAGDLLATAPSPVLRNPAGPDIPKIPSPGRIDIREFSLCGPCKAIGAATSPPRHRLTHLYGESVSRRGAHPFGRSPTASVRSGRVPEDAGSGPSLIGSVILAVGAPPPRATGTVKNPFPTEVDQENAVAD